MANIVNARNVGASFICEKCGYLMHFSDFDRKAPERVRTWCNYHGCTEYDKQFWYYVPQVELFAVEPDAVRA